MPSPLWEVRREVGLLLYEWGRGKRRTREVAKVSVGSGMYLWEGGAEGDQVFLSHTACHSLFLCIFSHLLPLYLVSPPSEPWRWLLGWTESLPWFCPSASSGVEFLVSALQAASGISLALPFPLPLKPVQPVCWGPVPDCVFFRHWPGSSSLALRFRLFQWTEPALHLGGSFWIHGGPSYLCNSIEKMGAK